jgi:hypothetical protein
MDDELIEQIRLLSKRTIIVTITRYHAMLFIEMA